MYSKSCIKQPLKKDTKKSVFMTYYHLMQVKITADCSPWAFCNTLTFIKLPFVIKTFVLSIFEWPLKTGFTVPQPDIFHWNLEMNSGLQIKGCNWKLFLFLNYTCYGYSKESSQWGSSFEHPKHFLTILRWKKNASLDLQMITKLPFIVIYFEYILHWMQEVLLNKRKSLLKLCIKESKDLLYKHYIVHNFPFWYIKLFPMTFQNNFL